MNTELSNAKTKLKEKETKIKYPIKTEFELCYDDIDSYQKFYLPLLRDLCKEIWLLWTNVSSIDKYHNAKCWCIMAEFKTFTCCYS